MKPSQVSKRHIKDEKTPNEEMAKKEVDTKTSVKENLM